MNLSLRKNIRLYHPEAQEVEPKKPAIGKIRIAIVTSIRDVGGDDRNGSIVQTSEGPRYMPGVTEMLIRTIEDRFDDPTGSRLLEENRRLANTVDYFQKEIANRLQFAGLIYDDHPEDNLNGYSLNPSYYEGLWIHPADLRDQNGELVRSNTAHIPSGFRKISSKKDPLGKAEAKNDFEMALHGAATEMGADVLLSDHLMLRMQNILRPELGRVGRILNIHPAITQGKTALRGKSPTWDAINRANEYGYTGATFHMVNEILDDGPTIADTEPTAVHPDMRPQDLRYTNYVNAKITALLGGLIHYIDEIYPVTDGVNLPSTKPNSYRPNPAV